MFMRPPQVDRPESSPARQCKFRKGTDGGDNQAKEHDFFHAAAPHCPICISITQSRQQMFRSVATARQTM